MITKKIAALCVALFLGYLPLAKAQSALITLKLPDGTLEGTLLMPATKTPVPLVLIIAGSGPTDRNGNQEEMKNNSLKYMAEELEKKGIASVRYDKRGIGQSTEIEKDEYTMRFETFVNDVRAWVDFLSKDKRFSKIIIAGHSEGSLLGILASVYNKKVHAFVSIAGPGRPMDEILKEQLKDVQADARTTMYSYIDRLKKGDSLGAVPVIFYGLFRPSIQPFLASFMKYNPQEEISKLNIPVLILQGTTDVQVTEVDARALHEALPSSKLVLIKEMNHVLKDCDVTDKKEQLKFYSDPDLPLNKEFVEELGTFLRALK